METPAKSARINQALTVLRKAQDGMTIIDACEEVGIPRSTFYDVCKKNPEPIEAFNNEIRGKELMELGIILAKHSAVLENTIADALDENTKPRQRLAIKKYFDKRVEQLSEKFLKRRSDPENIKKFLSGPRLEPGRSRFSASETTVISYPTSGSY